MGSFSDRNFALVVALAFVSAVALRGQNRPEVAILQALDFNEAKSVQLARIDGSSYGRSLAPDAFDGYPVIAPWRTLSPGLGAEIVSVLRDQLRSDLAFYRGARSDAVKLSSFCLFDPDYALKIATDRGDRTFLVCLVCDQLEVYDGRMHFWSGKRKHFWSMDFDRSVASQLSKLLNRYR